MRSTRVCLPGHDISSSVRNKRGQVSCLPISSRRNDNNCTSNISSSSSRGKGGGGRNAKKLRTKKNEGNLKRTESDGEELRAPYYVSLLCSGSRPWHQILEACEIYAGCEVHEDQTWMLQVTQSAEKSNSKVTAPGCGYERTHTRGAQRGSGFTAFGEDLVHRDRRSPNPAEPVV